MMRYILLLLLLPLLIGYVNAQSPSPGSTLTFYITDENLVTDHRGVMTLSTAGLVDFTINGTPIEGPGSMVETGIDTGMFVLYLDLPSSVNGRPLQSGDVVLMTYNQPADYSGHPQMITQSVVLNSVPTTPVAPPSDSGQSINIGQYYTLQLYAPNYNLDSQVPDDIPLNIVGVHMGGVSTTLADPAFNIGNGVLRETGPNTDTFAATFKIPRSIDGFPVEIGSTLEFRVQDNSQQIPSESSIFLRIGVHYNPNTYASAPPSASMSNSINVKTTSTVGTNVNFTNYNVLQGYADPVCYPASGSFFPIGTTTVTCSALNPAGTSALKSFAVTVTHGSSPIPSWVKNVAGFWCAGKIQDSEFKTTLSFLNSSKVIYIPLFQGNSQPVDKSGICSWSDGKITDDAAMQLFYQLIR